LRHRVRETAEYNRLAAPNPYDAIGFDDFVLFARVTKRIALQLCKIARPSDVFVTSMAGLQLVFALIW
jgi:hypothetical protein